MKIAIIGSGNVGSALAKGFLKNGHQITFGVRDQKAFKGSAFLSQPLTSATSIKEASRSSEVIVIAAVPQAIHDIAHQLGDVSGKVIIDTMNSFRIKPEGFSNTSSALMQLTSCKDIVKCFNTTGAENMADPVYQSKGIDMFYAGDSERAKKIAKQLGTEIGFEEIYDFGGSDKFDLLEQFAFVWINLAGKQGNRDIAFKVIKR